MNIIDLFVIIMGIIILATFGTMLVYEFRDSKDFFERINRKNPHKAKPRI